MRQAYNSTIGLKRKRCKTCGNMDYMFSHGECKNCATISSTKKRFEKEDNREQVEDLSCLIEDLDTVFSRYIRIKYADNDGLVSCFTCNDKPIHFTRMQCGHYIPRTHLATRWLEENCRPQNEHCNCMLSGNLEVFKERLEEERTGITDWLLEQSRQVSKPSRWELKELLATYRAKLKIVEQKLKK